MIKHMYVSGDSFSFGQELSRHNPPDDFYEFTEVQRRNCFSGIIADTLGIAGYENTSMPGGSNDRIIRKTFFDIGKLLESNDPSEIFVMISLTQANRREFFDSAMEKYLPYQNNHRPPNVARGLNGDRNVRFWRHYTAFNDSLIEHYDRWLVQVLSLQSYFKANKIPYLITDSLVDYWESMEYRRQLPTYMTSQIDRVRYPLESFHGFCESRDIEYGPEKHPLEEGHRQWAQHLLAYINEHNLLDGTK